ncbi:MAG: pilus assembly protein PilP [Mariprofundaceae bacterium]|nr:pilus assembly protein PilP [Mariprofundaceae bacterium]
MTFKLTAMLVMLMAVCFMHTPFGTAAESATSPAKAKIEGVKGEKQASSVAAHRIKAPKVDIASLRDPFESYLAVIERSNRLKKEKIRVKKLQRAREPLENFDLAALKLVAILKIGDARAAMVEDSEGKGYVLRKGSYIGRDSGRVVSISDKNVVILEDVLSPAGESVKRKATLTLNEVN